MKKTLVALAVLAASSASFAQVAITGAVAMGWLGGQDSTGSQSSGLGVDTATLDFAVTEDLGGGLKVTAHQGFDTIARTGVIGGDTGMTLGTSAFTISLDSKQYADYLQGGNANVSGTFNSFEGRVLGYKQNKDAVGIAIPFGPVTLSVTEFESTQGLGLGTGGSGATGTYGAGTSATIVGGTGSRNTQYQIAYKSGALGADAAYKAYDSSSSATSAYTGKSITRAAVSYDFGVAKIGGGVTAVSLINGGTDTQTVLSAAVPFGALTFGVQAVNRNVNGSNTALVTTNDFNQGGYGLELDYNFSKSTKLAVNYLNWQQTPTAAIGIPPGGGTIPAGYTGTSSNLTEIALVKSF